MNSICHCKTFFFHFSHNLLPFSSSSCKYLNGNYTLFIIIHKVASLKFCWSKCITWLRVPQLTLGSTGDLSHVHKFSNLTFDLRKDLKIIGHTDNITSPRLFLELHSWKTLIFCSSIQMNSIDKHLCTFLYQMSRKASKNWQCLYPTTHQVPTLRKRPELFICMSIIPKCLLDMDVSCGCDIELMVLNICYI